MGHRTRLHSREAFVITTALLLLLGGAACAESEPADATTASPSISPSVSPEEFARLTQTRSANERAPDRFRVEFDTTKGRVLLEVDRSWSPHGADRFYNLVRLGFYEDIAFFRVVADFMVQFGMHGNPRINAAWTKAPIPDDPVRQSNTRGMITFAKQSRPNTRTTQLFINLVDNKSLDRKGFAPFARVVEGMDVVDQIYVVGEAAPQGRGPRQQRIKILGNAYLREEFPKLDYLKSARIVE